MPLWDIHTPPGALSPEEKQHIAKSLTPIYTSAGIPAFYVRVRFQEYEPVNVYSGGESDDKIVLIEVLHLARTMPNDEVKERFLNTVDKVLTPVLEKKGVSNLWM
jgi:phenylpyruvate tautomerase PptA (4-oxalocrotonate tautomerase family)